MEKTFEIEIRNEFNNKKKKVETTARTKTTHIMGVARVRWEDSHIRIGCLEMLNGHYNV